MATSIPTANSFGIHLISVKAVELAGCSDEQSKYPSLEFVAGQSVNPIIQTASGGNPKAASNALDRLVDNHALLTVC